jgi:ADP-heptose:LPS heptosyltransferase
MPAESERKILVIRGGALGDFILTLPALAALRRHFPRHQLEILGYPSIGSLAVAAGLASRVSALESPALAGFFAPDGAWKKDASAYFRGFEIIVSYLHDTEAVFQANVARCTPARFVAGPHRPDESLNLPASEILLRPLEALGIRGADPRPRLPLPEPAPVRQGAWLAMHPGSGSQTKNWPEAKWGDLIGRLAAGTRWNFLLIAGEAEGGRGRRLARRAPAGRLQLAENLPLPELAREIRSCAAFIGHDSGITHLAAALGLPGLALWGRTSAQTWRPMSVKMRLLKDQRGLDALAVDKVTEAVLRLMS